MSGWGTGWDKPLIDPKMELHIGVDPAKPGSEQTIHGVWTAEGFKEISEEEFQNKFKNIAPTHDPYTNPGAHIYYECGC